MVIIFSIVSELLKGNNKNKNAYKNKFIIKQTTPAQYRSSQTQKRCYVKNQKNLFRFLFKIHLKKTFNRSL